MRVVAEEIAFDQNLRYIGRDVIAHAGFAQQRMPERDQSVGWITQGSGSGHEIRT
jgi:hypothetical protein